MVSRAPGSIATMVAYSERLQKAIDDAGTDVRSLAKEIGVTYQAVKKVLDGGSGMLSAENNSKAAAELDVSTDWLATGQGLKERGMNPTNPGILVAALRLHLKQHNTTRRGQIGALLVKLAQDPTDDEVRDELIGEFERPPSKQAA